MIFQYTPSLISVLYTYTEGGYTPPDMCDEIVNEVNKVNNTIDEMTIVC